MMVHVRSQLVRAAAVTVFVVAIVPLDRADAAPPLCLEAMAATIIGTEGDDVLTGTAGPDVIVGLGGADTIRGEDGADLICGGDGDDVIDGGSGNDQIVGNVGNDLMRGGTGADNLGGGIVGSIIDDSGQRHGVRGLGQRQLGGVGNRAGDVDHFYGGSGNDSAAGADDGRQILRGQTGDDDLRGGNAADVILGGPGNDRLAGFLGDDSLRGGSGTDTVDYSQVLVDGIFTSLPVRVDLQRQRATGVGRDTLSSIEGVRGGEAIDVLLGSRGPNIFYLGSNSIWVDNERHTSMVT